MEDSIHSIAIILGDNDFGSTFVNLLHTIKHALDYNENISKKTLKKIIYSGIRFHYVAFQNDYEWTDVGVIDNDADFQCHVDRIEKYLLTASILFNKKADNAYQTEDHDSGAWHLEVKSGQINYF